ncbi:MAG TPA: iron-containing redox enzyme family protein [Gemmatimonadaceae bacterium]|nr:iron-containing redox enzyme family protein [Gemmatimonadaceae bacterium]
MNASAAPLQTDIQREILSTIELPTIALLPDTTSTGAREDDLAAILNRLLQEKDLDKRLEADIGREERLITSARTLAKRAYPSKRTTDRQTASWIEHDARDELHRALTVLYQQHVRLPVDVSLANQFHPLPCTLMRILERPWEDDMLRRVKASHDVSEKALPSDASEFAQWFRDTAFNHPLYEHDLYTFIASEATRSQLEWFFQMECAGEAAFDDLVALGQVGTRGEVKMEMASNYWDEMGKGKPHAVHTHLFHKLIEGLQLKAPPASQLPWQVLAGVNVMLWSCIPRRNAFRAQGTLGAVELLAPQRCTRVVHGALRVGMKKKTVVYYAAHAIIDIGHAEGWLDHVVTPQVALHPSSRVGIAEGLIARADASLDYFDYCLAAARNLAS